MSGSTYGFFPVGNSGSLLIFGGGNTGIGAATQFTAPWNTFVATSWAPSGATNVGAADQGNGTVETGITPALLSAQQSALQQQGQVGIADLTNAGMVGLGFLGTFLSNWGSNIASVNSQTANNATTAINKSAAACGGFLGCLFG